MKILDTIDTEKDIYLAEHNGKQIIVTPDGEQQKGWVMLDSELWEEVGYINGYVNILDELNNV